jgi:predicted transcriptional regulator
MATTTIRVSEETREALRALAASTGEPMARLIERAVAHLRAEEFFAELDHAYDRLHADADASAAEAAERKEWETTLADGLDVG